MAAGKYNWTTVPGGFTGPSGKIGMQSPDGAWHIDTKISSEMSPEDVVNSFTEAARAYRKIGRTIQFSNQGVSNKNFNPDAPFKERLALIQAASNAHSAGGRHHPGWYSLDYYVVLPGKDKTINRFTPGTVEDASIFVPAPIGTKVQYATGGGYGFYTTVIDPKTGRPIIKTGHGNEDRPIKDKNNFIVEGTTTFPATTSTAKPTGKTDGSFTTLPQIQQPAVKIVINNGLYGEKNRKTPTDNFLTMYTKSLFGGDNDTNYYEDATTDDNEDNGSDRSSPYMAFMQKFLTETISKMFSGSNSNSSSNTG